MGQARQAIEELLPVLKEDQEGEIHYRLAGLYRRIGDKTREREALAAFKQLHAAAPQSELSDLEALEKQQEAVGHANSPRPLR